MTLMDSLSIIQLVGFVCLSWLVCYTGAYVTTYEAQALFPQSSSESELVLIVGKCYSGDSDVVFSVLERWEVLQGQMASTTKDYFGASIALEDTCALLEAQGLLARFPETYYSKVENEIANIYIYETRLQRARNMLAKVRNRSRAQCPINILPTEIILTIFSINDDGCANSCFSLARSMTRPAIPSWANVCSRWRQLYLQWHSTASHMDLIASGEQSSDYYRYAEFALLSRLNIPLHIVIQDRVNETSDANEVSSEEIGQLLRFLRPALPRVFAIEIRLKSNSTLLLNCVASSWARESSGGRSRILKIWNSSNNDPVMLENYIEFSCPEAVYNCESKGLLDSVGTLVTRNCHLELGIEMFNVKRLNLEHLYGTSLKRFRQILSLCRVLHTLLIEDIDFSSEEGAAEPLWLNSLRNLCLAQVQTEHCLRHLLPLLNTTSPINLIMRMSPAPNFVLESQGFFGRSNVKRIFVYGNERYQLGSVISLCPAQTLQELILRDCTLEIDSGEGSTSSINRTVWPLLHTLYLVGCTIDRETLKQLLDLHPIRKLRIFGGYANPFCFHRLLADECLELEEFLSRPNLDMKAVIHEDHCPDRSNFFNGAYG